MKTLAKYIILILLLFFFQKSNANIPLDSALNSRITNLNSIKTQLLSYQSYFQQAFDLVSRYKEDEGIKSYLNAIEALNAETQIINISNYELYELHYLLKYYQNNILEKEEKEIGQKLFLGIIKGDLKDDIEMVNRCLLNYPKSIFARRLKIYYASQFDQRNLLKYLDKELIKYPNDVSYLLLRGQCSYLINERRQSINYFKKVIQLAPENGYSYYCLGLIYLELSNFPYAIENLNAAVKMYPKYTSASFLKASLYFDQENYTTSIKEFKQIMKVNPEFTYGYYCISNNFLKLDSLDSAHHYIDKYNSEISDYADSYFLKAKIYEEQEKLSLAIQEFSKAIYISPENIKYIVNRGEAFENAKNIDSAMMDFVRANTIIENKSYTLSKIGDCHLFKKNYQKAIDFYTEAMKKGFSQIQGYYNIGRVYSAQKNYETSNRYFLKVIKINPKSTRSYFNLGLNFSRMKDYNSSIMSYQKILTIDSLDYSAWGNIGWSYYCLGEFEKCIENSEKAISIDESAVYAMFNICISTLRLGEFEKSKKLYIDYLTLCKEKNYKVNEGSRTDLFDLIEKNILITESKFILDTIFKDTSISE